MMNLVASLMSCCAFLILRLEFGNESLAISNLIEILVILGHKGNFEFSILLDMHLFDCGVGHVDLLDRIGILSCLHLVEE